jgi:hypothetical protein
MHVREFVCRFVHDKKYLFYWGFKNNPKVPSLKERETFKFLRANFASSKIAVLYRGTSRNHGHESGARDCTAVDAGHFVN